MQSALITVLLYLLFILWNIPYLWSFLPHCNENPIYVFLFWELRGLSPNFHMCLWAIYIFPGSIQAFSCSRIGTPILEIYKSLTDIWV